VQAAVGSHCLECAKAARPDVATRGQLWRSRQLNPVTTVLIALNVAVFAYVTAKEPDTLGGRGPSREQFDLGLNKQVIAATDEWYRLVTSGFLHFGVIHLAFNMLLLYQLGQMLERALGSLRFGMLYFAGLLGGSLGALIIDKNAITGGASGAVFGLMAAAAVGLHRQGVNVFSTGIGTTLILNLVLTFSLRGVSIGGHLGGATAGAICGFVMMAPKWRPFPRWATYATPAAILVGSLVASYVVVG